MKRRGQVTIFVIIGLIILLAAALFFFLNKDISEDKPGLDVPDVSLEARPAVELIQRCLLNSAEKGLREIGRQGGTLNPPDVGYPPHRGEAVLFTPDVIPYWRYLTDCENPSGCEVIFEPGLCAPGNKYCDGMPTAEDNIQSTLENYIDEDIESCIRNFEDIGQQYDITIDGVPKSEVVFSEGVTHVFLNYPITITSMSTDNIQELEDYRVEVDVDMYDMYKLANEILNFARDSDYYERQTMNLIAAYADIDSPYLPPIDEVQFFSGAAGPWVQEEVRETLQYDLLPFMSLVRFANTKNNVPLREDDKTLDEYKKYSDGFYASFMPKTSDTIYRNFDVYHNYLYEPIYSKVGDGSTLIKGTSLVDIEPGIVSAIFQIFLKDYRFSYDVSYPLVISIEDEDAFNGAGYSFQFAIEVNVRNNMPGYTNFTYVNVPTTKSLDLETLHLPYNMTIITSDKYTQESLSDVAVSYVCGNEYDLGATKQSSEDSRLVTTMPYCEYGGFIKFNKDGYLGTSIPFNNRDNGSDQTFNVDLWPLKEKEIIVQKRTANNINDIQNAGTDAMWMYDSAYENISSNDMALVNIQRYEETPYDDPVPMISFIRYVTQDTIDFDTTTSTKEAIELGYQEGYYTEEERNELIAAVDEGKTSFTPKSTYTMKLAPGTYSLDATLVDKAGLYLAAETVELDDVDWVTKLVVPDATEFDFPEQNFSSWVTGGAKLNFTMSPAQVYRDDPIIVYVLEQTKPTNWPEFMDMPELDSLISSYKFLLDPKY